MNYTKKILIVLFNRFFYLLEKNTIFPALVISHDMNNRSAASHVTRPRLQFGHSLQLSIIIIIIMIN